MSGLTMRLREDSGGANGRIGKRLQIGGPNKGAPLLAGRSAALGSTSR